MPKKLVTVNTKVGTSYEVDLTTRHFSLKIDQPKPSGKDGAPTPLEFLFFALGACTCTIGKIIAEQRKIDLKSIDATVEGDIDTDFLLGKTNEGRAGFTNIRVKVKIDADLTFEEKKAFLRDVAKRCPVHDNIEHESKVEFEVQS